MKNLIILLFLAAGSTLQAQHHVEVSVTDTVLINADRFVFQVYPMVDYPMVETAPPRPVDYSMRERDMRELQKKAIDDVESKLRAAGFATIPPGIHDMMASRGFGHHFLRYQINSAADLIRFQKVLRNISNINTALQAASSTQEQAVETRLYHKMLLRAQAKAAYLAQISGKRITGIVSVTDHTEGGDMSGMPHWRNAATSTTTDSEVNTVYPKTGRMVVRFSWQ